HSPRMLVAERVVDELVAAVRAWTPDPDAAGAGARLVEAARVLEGWDRTAAAQSRGGVLFKEWERLYAAAIDTARFFREPWTKERPMETPVGLGEPEAAVAALYAAVDSLEARGWALDVPWGDVHRVIRGGVDEPVSGCEPTLGCFRTLSFEDTADGRRAANRGDAWVFAVEFGEVPRGYSVLAYGQSPKEDSPHHADQAALFARGEMKPIAWTEADIRARTIRRYRPGRE
ncbi:MAG TPA: penicillin acylase family protein, partial [Longimicrobiales bacterium]|nr:penicillin acylase family protein [Longimicrobiales bacterium]